MGQVHADDADEGINGEIYFSLMDPKSSFAVHPVTGVVSLTRPLSYQKKPRHEITVVAQDRGAKSRFATRAPDTATLHLSVRQVRKKDYRRVSQANECVLYDRNYPEKLV